MKAAASRDPSREDDERPEIEHRSVPSEMPQRIRHATVHLTPRELEVLSLLCEGLANKAIARRLRISAGTVKVHISNILRALNVGTRLQAVLLARRVGLVDERAEWHEAHHPHRATHR